MRLVDGGRTRVLVTGVAGFVGSHTARLLIDQFDTSVIGVDAFTPYYDRSLKEANLATLSELPGFEFREAEIGPGFGDAILDGVDTVIHLAAQPGVRDSWAEFDTYTRHNVLATKHLLDLCVNRGVERFVYASSSSVYGDADVYPVTEDTVPAPRSPYGVTKLAAEHLVNAYAAESGMSTVSLRYFTVYGARQRPDMAFGRLIGAALTGSRFNWLGDGDPIRDFTHVSDVARANALAALRPDLEPGTVLNICSQSPVRLSEVVALIEEITDSTITRVARPRAAGDVRRTGGSRARATSTLGWVPATDLESGLREQVAAAAVELDSSAEILA